MVICWSRTRPSRTARGSRSSSALASAGMGRENVMSPIFHHAGVMDRAYVKYLTYLGWHGRLAVEGMV
ncbi:hypothetical protein L3i22_094420 [Actinoplanes sp. L3-i22]|nr:hypothetical protein L3i22_094420 [Actinoplanes sp. L3-i22]